MGDRTLLVDCKGKNCHLSITAQSVSHKRIYMINHNFGVVGPLTLKRSLRTSEQVSFTSDVGQLS